MADEKKTLVTPQTANGKPIVIALERNDWGTLEGALRQVKAVVKNKDEVYEAIAKHINQDRLIDHMLHVHKGQDCLEANCGAIDLTGAELEAGYVYDHYNKQVILKSHAEAVLGPDNVFKILP
jgi:hypothetical protein